MAENMNIYKTYIAFDAYGVIDHENSNMPVYVSLERWAMEYPDRFCFVNTDDIDFSAEHEDPVDSTVKGHFLQRMADADNLLVIASAKTHVESPILNWQISKAVNRYHLPVVVAYDGFDKVDEQTMVDFFGHLPNKIRKYMGRNSAPIAHIPLTKDKLERALSSFSVKDGLFAWDSRTIF